MNRNIRDALLDELIPVPDKFVKAEEIRSALEAKGFKISYWENGGIYKTLIMIFLQIYEELVHLLRFVLFNVYLKTAGDAWLDVKANDFSRYRKEALKTKGQVTLRRSQAAGVIEIPKGYIFKTEADSKGNEYRFIVPEKQFMKAHETETKIKVTAEHEGEEYNVPPGKITKCLQYIGNIEITNEKDWITREGSTREDDESLRERTVDWWDELAQLPTGPKYRAIALKVPGVMQCYVDDLHPRGQGTVDIILIGAAGVPTEALIAAVKKEVEKVRGPYDDIEYVSPTEQMTDVSVEIFIDKLIDDTNVKALAKETIENLLKNVRWPLAESFIPREDHRRTDEHSGNSKCESTHAGGGYHRQQSNYYPPARLHNRRKEGVSMDSYKEYMIDLLHAPFKKVKREVNHWKILMQVLGEEFDQMKESIFRIRDESAIHTATSSRALDMIGDGMRMKRFEGEDDERFRKRLLAKRAIAEMAGTRSGIRYAMKSLGFEEVEILPPMDPLHPDQKDMQRWAEFILQLGGKRVPVEHRKQWEIIQSEVRRVKQASSKLAGISIIEREQTPIYLALHMRSLKKIASPPARIEQLKLSSEKYVALHTRQLRNIASRPAVIEPSESIGTKVIGAHTRFIKVIKEG